MKFDRNILFSVFALFLMLGLGAQSSMGDSRVLLAVPVTEDAVKLAFDVAELRAVDIVTYERDYKGEAFLNAWDATTAEWRSVTVSDVVSGRAFGKSSENAVVLGPPKGIPTNFAGALASSGARHVPTLEVAVVINKLDGLFGFSSREWRWLSDRHGLKLYDRNYDRRRWGKYGPPEGATPSQPPIGVNLGSKTIDEVEVVDIKIEPTEIKTPDEVRRTPRLVIPPDGEVKLTGGPALEMEITPVTDIPPVSAEVPEVADEVEVDAAPDAPASGDVALPASAPVEDIEP